MSQENFLNQSYFDAWNDYQYVLKNPEKEHWDWVVITASDEQQADGYRVQIDKRKKENRLPSCTNFAVIPDRAGKRNGSGGATLNVLKYLCEQVGVEQVDQLKILVLHSGGDSKRIPQYSACGKLFAPVPRTLPNGYSSTIFDELLIEFASIPTRCGAGLLTMSGDTEMIFSPLQLELYTHDAVGISIKTDVSEGEHHGVFHKDNNNNVINFLHKKTEAELREIGAVDVNGKVNIDTGCIWFSNRVIKGLLNLFCEENKVNDNLFDQYVNDNVCLSFYADFVYPLAKEATLKDYYKETPEANFTEELLECRTKIWSEISKYSMKSICLSPARYIHFGSTPEMFDLVVNNMEEFAYLDWKRQTCSNMKGENYPTIYNSFVDKNAEICKKEYIENSIIGQNCIVGQNTILADVTINDIEIPDGVVLSGLVLKNGKYVCRIYGVEDNPKNSMDSSFLKSTLRDIVSYTKVKESEIWDQNAIPVSIWNAKLYPVCETMKEAINMALILYKISEQTSSQEEIDIWKNAKKLSLNSSFMQADYQAMVKRQEHIRHLVHISNCEIKLRNNDSISAMNELYLEDEAELILLVGQYKNATFPMNMRWCFLLSEICKVKNCKLAGKDRAGWENETYEIIKQEILTSVANEYPIDSNKVKFVQDKVKVELPARVNFCGSPSDAAPYCLEHGGTMLDGAILLNGEYPISAYVEKLEEHVICLESIDLEASIKETSIGNIINCGNVKDTFGIHRAVLVASGVINEEDTMESFCNRIGGGLKLVTYANIPKGSGLGTSSIVAAACLKAINTIFNLDCSNDKLYAQVFATEQLMNTGGGWQDQVGGLTNGIKLMVSKPGINQDIKLEYINLSDEIKEEFDKRFCLIFSGQRRLARNVLREETNQCIRNDSTSMQVIDRIKHLCVIMKYELEQGNIAEFGKCLSEQYSLVKQLDKGASNRCIEYLFEVCEDLIDGKSICGAGGGGFLQVVLKEGATKQMLKDRLEKEFYDCGVEVWNASLI